MTLLAVMSMVILIVGCQTVSPPDSFAGPIPTLTTLPPGLVGVNAVTLADSATRDRQYHQIAADHFRAIRLQIEWDLIERSPGQFDWGYTDSLVNGAASRGLAVLGVLSYAPSWAVPPRYRDLVHPAPADAGTWAAFVAQAAKRYSNVIHNWEIWNEPNIDDSFAPGPDLALYSSMLKESYRAIKSIDPESVVITGGTSPAVDTPTEMSPVTFIKGLYDNGAGNFFDAIAMHPYSTPELLTAEGTSDTSNSNQAIKDVSALMAKEGQGGKMLWFTEFGASTATPGAVAPDLSGQQVGVSPQRQSEILTNGIEFLRSLHNGGPIFLFDFRDVDTGSRNVEYNYGLVRSDFTAKPALTAVQALLG
ncbi:cellulase family glycosylhydrolase [Mycolicibacterium sp. 018/SC-01/001]|uniref:cellulase family glycosylhydrolase n=1 Tax=Mycolicibacterium sp. 018/SC-01/001 TaxID=2592069 RepID=UPI00163D6E28|nr:cellulase family glycosylhydrolase [Mycolicibacterium sp. 018/SC-01/001]